MQKKHIIFDFNGVIVDDEKIHFLSSKLALKEVFNHDLSQESYFKFFIGRTNEKAFEDYFEMLNIDSSIDGIIKLKNKIYMKIVETENVAIPSKAANAFCIALTTSHTKEELYQADIVVSELNISCFNFA
ncbi:MAG: hypothetical protein EBX39_12635 [Actinobacteria bacterium]|nr:hypothetical protein [Actinomycetota bacterium]